MKGAVLIFISVAIQITGLVTVFNNSSTLGWILFAIGCVSFVFSLIINGVKTKALHKDKRIRLSSRLKEVQGFNPNQRLYSNTNDLLISIDKNSEKLVITDFTKNKVIPFTDIIESEIILDEVSVSKVSRSGQIGGAIVGGILAGGIGAIIGGLSSGSKTIDKIKRITIKIVVNSTNNPNYKIVLLDSPFELSKEDLNVQSALKNAEHWHSVFKVLIKNTVPSSELI